MNQTIVKTLVLSEPLPLTIHPAAVYLRSLAPGSKPTMTTALNAIASLLSNGRCDIYTLDWAAIRYQHTAAVRASLLERYAPATASKIMCAFRRVLDEARKLGLMSAADYANAIDLPNIPNNSKLRGRALTLSEITALMGVCVTDKTPLGVRDAALIAILRGAGLRRGEAVKLNVRDFDPETGRLEINRAKGGKSRLVYLPLSAIVYVEHWLDVRSRRPGALLCPMRRGGLIEYRSMSSQAVLAVVQKRASEAGVESFSPHDFRRTFCSDLLDAGVDIVTVQKLAGHADPNTTAKYDRRGEEIKRKAVQKLGF
jgi:integrase/recombinase XerD